MSRKADRGSLGSCSARLLLLAVGASGLGLLRLCHCRRWLWGVGRPHGPPGIDGTLVGNVVKRPLVSLFGVLLRSLFHGGLFVVGLAISLYVILRRGRAGQ